jgi:Zn-dependent metalloprotease
MRSCVCLVVPPHILSKLAQDPAKSKSAMHTLALSGRLAGRREVASLFRLPTQALNQETRLVYDAQHSERLPGRLAWREGMPESADEQVREAAGYADATYQFYAKVFKRLSIDDRGLRLLSTVRYSHDFDNAFWDGNQMVYGEGDATVFLRFTKCLDVIGHELTHGVTQYTAGMEYYGQPGALNESVSDVFGSMVKQYHLQQTADTADWLIGAELLAPGVKGRAIRDLLNPGTAYDDVRLGTDPQPADMNGFVVTHEDNGGVHINSSIPSRAFAVAAKEAGGFSWNGPGLVWYRVLTTLQGRNADFKTWALATLSAARQIFGATHAVTTAVESGWTAVKVM